MLEVLKVVIWPVVTLLLVLGVAWMLVRKGLLTKSISWKNLKIEFGSTIFNGRIAQHVITVRQDDLGVKRDEVMNRLLKLLQVLSEGDNHENDFKKELILTKLDHAIYNISGIETGTWNVTIRQSIAYAQGILQTLVNQLKPRDEYWAVSSMLFWANPKDEFSGYLKNNFEAAKCDVSIKRLMVVSKRELTRVHYGITPDVPLPIEEFIDQCETLRSEYGGTANKLDLKFLYFEKHDGYSDFFRLWRGVGVGIRNSIDGPKLYTMVKFHKPPRANNLEDVELTVTIAKEKDRSHVSEIIQTVDKIRGFWRQGLTTHESGRLLNIEEMKIEIRRFNPGR